MSKKHYSKEQILKDNLSDGYKTIEKEEIADIVSMRDRWYKVNTIPKFLLDNFSNFEVTYKLEHG